MKVFRKIRIKLLSENKIRKYLAYALGEIVLVVIGILIALAINNANQKSVIRQKEQTYLSGLHNEFESSRQKLEELINVNHNNYEGALTIIRYMDGAQPPLTEKEFATLLFQTFAFDIAFNPNNSLLNEMISSGSLKDLRSTDLRRFLTNWISTLEDIAKQEADLGLQREKVLNLLAGTDYSMRTTFDLSGVSKNELELEPRQSHASNLQLLKSNEFENRVLVFILTTGATETSHYVPLLRDLNHIIELIEGELK